MKISPVQISKFEQQLEKAGFSGALRFIREELVPLAEKEDLSLIEAALRCANSDEDQDSSCYQLWLALLKLRESFPPTLHQGNFD